LGLDTVEANERLGFPADLRDYGVGAQILNDLGVQKIRLITNNPRKIAGLNGYGLEMVDRVPLLIEATSFNFNYLATKAEKLGHLFLQTYLVTIAIHTHGESEAVTERYERLEKLRHLAKTHDLMLQEEARPVASALFGQASLIVHLGFEQALVSDADWYKAPGHPYVGAIADILDAVTQWSFVHKLEFIISSGSDPLVGLQVQLDRQTFSLRQHPSSICDALETQTIYSFSQD
jgi:3,4-dihydroxy 2-butanone 4-phosphate synthase/GTP cyclohydrolase II